MTWPPRWTASAAPNRTPRTWTVSWSRPGVRSLGRDSLLSALDARRREEAAAAQAHRRREEAAEALRSAAALVGVTDAAGTGDSDDDPDLLAVRLEQW